jgi:DNA invertase Pin-like site-specific DNA recombinase
MSEQGGEPNERLRAAQYLRMSSDNQRYSTENQKNALAEYAELHGFSIVATYIDAGKSGLSLKGREALRQLLSDALSPQKLFDVILVLDVSRWGRFQNPDQAAHYEFLCRQAGVRVLYCTEPFGDDIAPITTIVKHLKRIMAGEYSRELSVKLSRAHSQQAQLGFRQGGKLIYGFRRMLLDPERNPRQILNSGQRKAVSSDKVVVVPGPEEELAVIKRIFRLYVRNGLSPTEIAKRLEKAGVKGYGDQALAPHTVKHILANELCIGQMTYNVTTRKLQSPTVYNPKHLWTRFQAFEPVVPLKVFQKAQERLAQSRQKLWDKEAIIQALSELLARKRRLSQVILNEADGGPCAETVVRRFGSLQAAYDAVGYKPPPMMPFGMNGKFWSKGEVLRGLRKLYKIEGRISTRLIDGFSELPSNCHIRRHFGSIPQALKEAGVPILSKEQIQQLAWKRRKEAGYDEYYYGVRWTDEKLFRALRWLQRQYGYISGNLLNQNGETPSAAYFVKRFGSLNKARALAKLPVLTHSQVTLAACKRRRDGTLLPRKRIRPRYPNQKPGLHYCSEDILSGLKCLAKREGRVSARLIDEDANLPAWGTVVKHFGSLSAAYRLAGLVQISASPKTFGLARD